MESATSRDLKSGDKITFGVYNSKFRVVYGPLVACSSCLSSTEKSSLNQALQLLGGHVVNNWTENCTHLVMASIKVTIKTICALICCKSIVKPEYFSEVIKAIKEKRSLPELTSFVPIIDEPSLQDDSLDVSENRKRKTIFKDYIFLFLTAKQHKKLSPAVHFGGGKAQLLVGECDDKHLLGNPKTLVIDVGATESQLSESQTPTWVTSIMTILQGKGLRAIPEAEIGLAVIYMSTEIYCNPQQRAGNRNETEKATRSNIIGSSFSSSMAVNETIMPVSTFNTTAYVADTEPHDQTHNWVDISGAQEVKETPKSSRHYSTKSDISMDCDLESSSSVDSRSALFQEQSKPTEKKSQPIISVEKPASQKAKTSQKMVSSKMLDYFKPTAKKRDRGVDEGEMSTAKMARVESGISPGSHPGKNVSSVKQKDLDILSSNDMDLDTEPNVVSKEKTDLSDRWPKGNNDASMSGTVKDASPQRKQPDDDVVEESDVENDEISDQVKEKTHKTNPVMIKRQRLDSGEDVKAGLSGNSIRTTHSEQKVKTEPLVKQEPESPSEDKKTVMMLVHPKKENDDNLPNSLLLTEFRTLVVSRSAGCSQYTTIVKQRNGPNFKKFRKAAYPGAGSFPHIIGGSDLIAHDKKKNSELEQWLRQEMEEQTQQAREQSLAEDLFRYNPKNVKKRR